MVPLPDQLRESLIQSPAFAQYDWFSGSKPGSTDSLGLRGAETTNQVPF